jgi:hypothetical protein
MLSIYDLAYKYIKDNKITDDLEKKTIIRAITEVLNNGASSDDVYRKIESGRCTDTEYKEYFNSVKPSGNLLKAPKVYYHNELRITSAAPLKQFDINSGEIVSVKQEHFLEMRASYTVDELYNYVKRKEYLAKPLKDEARAKGSLVYLLKKYDIDFLLFLIDTSNDIYGSKLKYARTVIELSDYETEAKENYVRRITECAISGSDKISYRKRESI